MASHCPHPVPESSATISMERSASEGKGTFQAHQALCSDSGSCEAITLPVLALITFTERPLLGPVGESPAL